MNRNLINKLIRKLTKNGTINDLYEIARNNNIVIYENNIGEGGGLYFYTMRTKIIILNTKLSYYHKMIVLAHEIAHALLHPYEEASFTIIGYSKASKNETEANYFTCKILDEIGFWNNDELCIYEHELSKSDLGFIQMYRGYLRECDKDG